MSEIKLRKKLLAKRGMDYLNYIKSDNPPLPNYVVIINGFDSFKEQFDDFITYNFLSIIRECNKYGITLIIASATNSLSGVQQDQFSQIISLKQNDPTEYSALFETRMVPASNPGRGLIKIDGNIYQFQTALIAPVEKIDTTINLICNQLKTLTYKADGVPIMPDVVSYELFINKKYSLSNVPIGYNIDTIEDSLYDFDKYLNLIISNKTKNIFNFINGLTKLISKIENTKILIFDGNKDLNNLDKETVKYYDSGFSKLLKFLKENGNNNQSETKKIIIFISGYENIENHLKEYYKDQEDDSLYTLNNFIDDFSDSNMYKFVICGKYNSSKKFENEKWYNKLSKKDGIVIYSEFNDQDFVFGKRLDDEYNLNLDETNAFVVRNNQKEIITYISDD